MEFKVALSYYSERPGNIRPSHREGLEYLEKKMSFEKGLYRVLDKECVPRTIFILGNYIEGCDTYTSRENVKGVYNPGNPLNDIQSHGMKHLIIRKKRFEGKEPVTTEKFLDDLRSANEVIKNILGVHPDGVGFPYGFDTDLSEDTELMRGLKEIGFRFISNDTSGKETLEAPITAERQPHTYESVGFPGTVQIPTYGCQDVIFTNEKRNMFRFDDLRSQDSIAKYYIDIIKKAQNFEIEGPVYVSFCLHPWAVMEYDPQLNITKRIIESAKDSGAKFVSFSQIADDFLVE